MTPALLAFRLILASVFLAAGVAKLFDGAGSRGAAERVMPPGLARPLAASLPFVETVVGAGLLYRTTAWIAAMAAIPLLLIFLSVTALNMSRGSAPNCGCFGKLSASAPVMGSVVRSEILLAFAGLVVIAGRRDPGPDVFEWLGTFHPVTSLGAVALALALGLVVEWAPFVPRFFASLLALTPHARHAAPPGVHHPLDRPPSPFGMPRAGLPTGVPAPSVALDTEGGPALMLDDVVARGRPTVLLFAEPGCQPCLGARSRLLAWDAPDVARYSVVTVGMEGCACDGRAGAARAAYRVAAVPSAVLIGTNGRIASALATGAEAIGALTRQLA